MYHLIAMRYLQKIGIIILWMEMNYLMILRLEGCVDRHAPIKKLMKRKLNLKVIKCLLLQKAWKTAILKKECQL